MQQGLHRKVRRPVEQGSINELRKKLMPSYTLLMSTSDNLRAIAELMTVPNVLCVSMTEDEKLSIKLRPECSENTLLALSKQCVFYGLFGFIVSDTKAGFIAFLNILKAILCAGCVAGDNDFIGCSLKHSRNAAVGLYAGCIHDGIYAVYAHTYSVLFIRYGSGLDTCHASACYDFYAILLEAVKHDLIGYRFAVEHDIRLHFDNGDVLCAVHRHVVGRLRTDESAADDHNVLRLGHRAEIILGLHAGQRIDHAMYEKIFTKGKIGGVEIRNRVILSPTEETLGQASGEITPRAIEYSSIILSKSYSVINKNSPVYRCGFHPINQESLSWCAKTVYRSVAASASGFTKVHRSRATFTHPDKSLRCLCFHRIAPCF